MAEDRETEKPLLARRAREISFLILVVVVAGSVAAVAFLPEREGEPIPGEFGTSAPDFVVTTLEGETVSLQGELDAGRVVLLDFMFVECPPCRIEMLHLASVREAYSPVELTILSLDVDPTETEEMLAEFRDEFNATWHFAMDTDDVRGKYQVVHFPSLMIVDTDGEPAFAQAGIATFDELRAVLDSLL